MFSLKLLPLPRAVLSGVKRSSKAPCPGPIKWYAAVPSLLVLAALSLALLTTASATDSSVCPVPLASFSMACVICWRVPSLSSAKLGNCCSTCIALLTGSINSRHSTWPIKRRLLMMLLMVRLVDTCAAWPSAISAWPFAQCKLIQYTRMALASLGWSGMRCHSWVKKPRSKPLARMPASSPFKSFSAMAPPFAPCASHTACAASRAALPSAM